jgi:hypothetical protein
VLLELFVVEVEEHLLILLLLDLQLVEVEILLVVQLSQIVAAVELEEVMHHILVETELQGL